MPITYSKSFFSLNATAMPMSTRGIIVATTARPGTKELTLPTGVEFKRFCSDLREPVGLLSHQSMPNVTDIVAVQNSHQLFCYVFRKVILRHFPLLFDVSKQPKILIKFINKLKQKILSEQQNVGNQIGVTILTVAQRLTSPTLSCKSGA